MTYTVTAHGIRKAYGPLVVLDGIDLAVEAGSVFALLGPNGAGKTTMVQILSTLVRPDAGHATVAGHDLLADAHGVRSSISLTGQYVAVDDLLTARENLVMMGRLRRLRPRQARERARELLAELDLEEAQDRRVQTYSGGMRRRLDLAISLIGRPPLIFLDEPTTGLDPRSRDGLWTAVRRLVDEGVTIFLTTQYLEEADQLADQVMMINGGQVVAQGTPDSLKQSLAREVVELVFGDAQDYESAFDLLRAEVTGEDSGRHALEVATDGSPEHLRVLLATLHAHRVRPQRLALHRPSLDDVFMSLTDHTRPAIQGVPA